MYALSILSPLDISRGLHEILHRPIEGKQESKTNPLDLRGRATEHHPLTLNSRARVDFDCTNNFLADVLPFAQSQLMGLCYWASLPQQSRTLKDFGYHSLGSNGSLLYMLSMSSPVLVKAKIRRPYTKRVELEPTSIELASTLQPPHLSVAIDELKNRGHLQPA